MKDTYWWIPMGQTIEIRSELPGEWCIAVVNPRGNSNAGIPDKGSREIADRIVRALNANDLTWLCKR